MEFNYNDLVKILHNSKNFNDLTANYVHAWIYNPKIDFYFFIIEIIPDFSI